MYYLQTFYNKCKKIYFKIADTEDGVVETYSKEQVVDFLKKGIDIKGIYLKPTEELFYHVIKLENFSDPDKIAKIIPWDYGDIAMIIRYKAEDNLDVMLENGAIIKKTRIPNTKYLPSGIEMEVNKLQDMVDALRLASRAKKSTFTFTETQELLRVSGKVLMEWYQAGLIGSFRYGVWQKYFQVTNEPMFSTKDIYEFLSKEYCRIKQVGCYTKEQLLRTMQIECGISDKVFLDRIDKFIPAITNSDGRQYYSQLQLDFLKVMYRRKGTI